MNNLDEISVVLKLLGDKSRLKILYTLNKTNVCVCKLVNILDMSQPSISQHLRKLKDANILNVEKKGQQIFYTLNHNYKFYFLIQDILKEL